MGVGGVAEFMSLQVPPHSKRLAAGGANETLPMDPPDMSHSVATEGEVFGAETAGKDRLLGLVFVVTGVVETEASFRILHLHATRRVGAHHRQ